MGHNILFALHTYEQIDKLAWHYGPTLKMPHF